MNIRIIIKSAIYAFIGKLFINIKKQQKNIKKQKKTNEKKEELWAFKERYMEIFGVPLWVVLLICLGVFIASVMDGIAGGGGIISLPTYLLAGLPMHMALGTNKLSSCIGTVASTARYVKNGCVDWLLAIPSIGLALLGAHMGTRLQLIVDEKYLKLMKIMFCEVNPIPVKAVLASLGYCSDTYRLPLCEMEAGAGDDMVRIVRQPMENP